MIKFCTYFDGHIYSDAGMCVPKQYCCFKVYQSTLLRIHITTVCAPALQFKC